MSNKSNKVSVFYGRARRIELYEKIAYIVIGIVAVLLIFFLVTSQEDNTELNVNYSFMRNYFTSMNYNCDSLHRSGGRCSKDTGTTAYIFVRNDDGFKYIVETDSYSLEIEHSLLNGDWILFDTTSEAFAGYKNKKYECKVNGNVLEKFGDCLTKDGELMNLNSYRGVIEMAQKDIENIIESSGYYRRTLMNDYKWEKK
mgnify:FL=1